MLRIVLPIALLSTCLLCVTAATSKVRAQTEPQSRTESTPAQQVPVGPPAVSFQPYDQKIGDTPFSIRLVPIPGGRFVMGSPPSEPGRDDDEGPQHEVELDPFWMTTTEITWNVYDVWGEKQDIQWRKLLGRTASAADRLADGVTRPTPPYTDMSFKMGKGRRPAICMTQHAARKFCEWLSAQTGHYYRLPTEAEWEYACRAGSTTAWHFGDDPAQLGDYAWYLDNSEDTYHEVGGKKPNAWGLYDMHGNVSEWVLDQYVDRYPAGRAKNPLVIPDRLYPRVVRGGGWDDTADWLRSANRIASDEDWKSQDPQLPRSIWYHTDALSVGFRIVRPLKAPSAAERAAKWDKTAPEQKDPPQDDIQ